MDLSIEPQILFNRDFRHAVDGNRIERMVLTHRTVTQRTVDGSARGWENQTGSMFSPKRLEQAHRRANVAVQVCERILIGGFRNGRTCVMVHDVAVPSSTSQSAEPRSQGTNDNRDASAGGISRSGDLSAITTVSPLPRSASATCRPMKPLPPKNHMANVTTTS